MISIKNKKIDYKNKDKFELINESLSELINENNFDTDNDKINSMKKMYSQILWKKAFIKYKHYKMKGYYLN